MALVSHCQVDTGQWLENADQTHLVLASTTRNNKANPQTLNLFPELSLLLLRRPLLLVKRVHGLPQLLLEQVC